MLNNTKFTHASTARTSDSVHLQGKDSETNSVFREARSEIPTHEISDDTDSIVSSLDTSGPCIRSHLMLIELNLSLTTSARGTPTGLCAPPALCPTLT